MRKLKSCIRTFLSITTLLYGFTTQATSFKELDYPELQVSPLASERLQLEADKENSKRWKNSLYFQVSAFSTLIATLTVDDKDNASDQDKKDLDNYKTIGALISLGWLFGNAALAWKYNPYQNGVTNVSHLPKGSQRQRITRERLAEEALAKPSDLISKLKWASVITNLGASVMLTSKASDESIAVPLVAGILSFAPLFFTHHWEYVSDQHQIYKKKIYGPIVSATLLKHPGDRKYSPGLALSHSF